MGIMNLWLGRLNKSGILAATQPRTHRLNPGEILVDNGAGPTPQDPGLYQSINVPQLQCPNFATKAEKQRSEDIKNMAKEGAADAIAVMKNLAAADKFAVDAEKHYYGEYRQTLTENYQERIKLKAGDMARLHKVRVHQAKATNKVNQASILANEAIAKIGQKKKEIAENW